MTQTQPSFPYRDDATARDPFAFYDRLRTEAPVHAVAEGVYFLTRHADCRAALADPRLSNAPAPFALLHQRHRATFLGADIANNLIAFRDAPEVGPARKALASAFMGFVRGQKPVLTEIAEKHSAPFVTHSRFDFVSDVAIPCALESMCRLMGFPADDAAQLKAWTSDFFYLFHAIPDRDTLVRVNESLSAFRAYTAAIVAARRAAPQDDLISLLVQTNADVLDETALVDNIMLFAADGVENVWAGFANAMKIVLSEPAAVTKARADGVAWADILNECLRLESPGQYQGRIVATPLEINGVALRRYSVLLVGLAAANRDPDAFETPNQFVPGRKGARDLSFGFGPHACIGKTLVSTQMVALFEVLAPYLPRASCRVTPDLWARRAGHRWLSQLPITMSDATSHAQEARI